MLFRENSSPFTFLSLMTLGALALYGGVYSDSESAGYGRMYSSEFASSESRVGSAGFNEKLETVTSCGPERNYFLKTLNQLPADYRQTRQQVQRAQIPRACVSFIMQNFIDARKTKSTVYGHCSTAAGQPQRGVDGNGSFMPCVTETYVNSVYNSLVDVADCLNIPIRELMPKLANESGLHINTLGPDADGGIGQLTRSALASVYMRYENIPERESTLDYYIREMSRSKKKSCQRIIAQKSAYQVDIPKGMKLCQTHEEDANCFKPWMVQSRCEFMTAPDNPLRNTLFTGIYYRTMMTNSTGILYVAGEDMYFDEGQYVLKRPEMDYRGFIARKGMMEKLRNLGLRNPSQDVVRQILVSFGFNGGIGTGTTLLDNYLKLREQKNMNLKPEDLDFQNISIAPWSLVTNPVSFLNMLAVAEEEEFSKAFARLDAVKVVKLNPESYKSQITTLRKKIRAKLSAIEGRQDEAAVKKAKVSFIDSSEVIRRAILNDVFDRAEYLTLPEFMRVGHAWTIAFKKGGGAPGYLSFLAAKHKELNTQMGVDVCTEKQYLQF